MKAYTIDVARIEELQTLKDVDELEKIFARAKSTIVSGETVLLVRKTSSAPAQKFDEFSTLEALHSYRASVLKYISN